MPATVSLALLLHTLLLAAGGDPAAPGEPVDPPAQKGDDAWLELDREIEKLHRELSVPLARFGLQSELIALYEYSSDELFQSSPGEDLSGFDLLRARIHAFVEVEEYALHVSGGLESGTMELADAFARREIGDVFSLQMGRYKLPLLHEAMIPLSRTLFHDRSFTAAELDERFLGVMATTGVQNLRLWASIQNGVDGQEDNLLFSGRVSYDLLGDTAFGPNGGALGYGEDLHLSVAGFAADDDGIENGRLYGAEAAFVWDQFALRGDVVTYDDDYDVGSGLDPDDFLGTSKADTTPWSVTASYLFGNDSWEVAYRLDDLDDPEDTDRQSFGLFYYPDASHRARWSLVYQEVDSDTGAIEGDRVQIGFTLIGG